MSMRKKLCGLLCARRTRKLKCNRALREPPVGIFTTREEMITNQGAKTTTLGEIRAPQGETINPQGEKITPLGETRSTRGKMIKLDGVPKEEYEERTVSSQNTSYEKGQWEPHET
ncbi:hypothetical protein E1301_Tti014320 [Triplophysa tibetana]|uniref:Uncharacterized protein n=1 Tax=Triplophysa tibetana TaxID=1572043 RepID=A0A5A9NFF6_9TELE|nr:hypothetical protein E1301_Tti014320 [Triplophysa tibetana]